MPLETRFSLAGVAKQTVKGTAIAVPAYGFGVRSGALHKVELEQDYDERTSLSYLQSGALREGVIYGQDFTTRMNYKSLPLYLYSLLGTLVTTGAGPYTHTITPSGAPPRLTTHGRVDSEYVRMTDCRVGEVKISWDESKVSEVGINLMGCSVLYGTTWTATADETGNVVIPTAGGTFEVDASGAAATAPITGGEITISRQLDPIVLSKQLEADDIWASTIECVVSLKLKPDSLAEFKKVVTGTGSGTALSTLPIYGGFNVKFQIDSSKSVQINADKVAFLCDWPESDAGGKAVEIALEGKVVVPTGKVLQAICINDVATY